MKIAIAKEREIKLQNGGHWVYIPVETVRENNLIVSKPLKRNRDSESNRNVLKYSLIIIEANNLIINSKEKLFELFKSIVEKLSPLPLENMKVTERQNFSEKVISTLKVSILNQKS